MHQYGQYFGNFNDINEIFYHLIVKFYFTNFIIGNTRQELTVDMKKGPLII